MSNFCSKCGTALDGSGKFCSKCGAEIKQSKPICPHCGQAMKKASKFCPHCGKDVMQTQDTFAHVSTEKKIIPKASVLQNAVNAPSVGGEFTVGANGITELTKGGITWIRSLIAGLGAGGVSCAALWNAEKPILISGCIAAAVVAVRVAVGLVRRNSR